MEDIAQVPRPQRSLLYLQPRMADGVLLLPGEGAGCEDLQPLAETLHGRGFTVLASALSIRDVERPGYGPVYWQTGADEAENRFDMLAHYANRVAIVAVGMSALFALHVATTRRVGEVAALFPAFGSEPGWVERLRATLRRVVLRDTRTPKGWAHQRQLAAHAARTITTKSGVPLWVLVEDRRDRSEATRSARFAQRLAQRPATQVRVLGPGEASSVRDLPPAVLDSLLAFLRRR